MSERTKALLSYAPYGPAHAILYNLACELMRAGPEKAVRTRSRQPVRTCFNIFTEVYLITRLSGHKNPKQVLTASYAVASRAQQRKMSKIMSGAPL